MKAEVRLSDMEFFSRHGCLEKERAEGNVFRVSVSFSYDASAAAASDSLEDAVDYSLIYKAVAVCMDHPSNLLENVAQRIKSEILRTVSGVEDLKVCVAKKNPPVGGPCAWAEITL